MANSRRAQSRSPCSLFPAIGGLAARGRNGYARLLLIIALCFAYIISYAPVTVALFAGYLALSFFVSDLSRDRAGIELGGRCTHPVVAAYSSACATVAAWIFHTRLASLPMPYPSLSVAADIFTHDKLRLITGHGFATAAHGFQTGILPAQTPQALAFTIWYELGIVGAGLSTVGAWLGFRSIILAPTRLAPYMAADLIGGCGARVPQC